MMCWGWILIPNTVISYPLLQGEDNQYYLNHTWKKWTSAVGAIFMDSQNNPNLTDFNTIVYGHRMNNGSMFASLKNYKKQSYWQAHPCVYITGIMAATNMIFLLLMRFLPRVSPISWAFPERQTSRSSWMGVWHSL